MVLFICNIGLSNITNSNFSSLSVEPQKTRECMDNKELLSNDALGVQSIDESFTTKEYHQHCSRLSIFDQNYGQPRDIFVEERDGRILAYIAEYFGGMTIFDVTDPANPLFLSQIGYFSTNLIYVYENIAYVGIYDDMVIIDVSFPEQPAEIGFYHSNMSTIYGIVGRDNFLFIVASFGLIVLDITNPHKPLDFGMSFYLPTMYYSVLLWEDFIFIAGTVYLRIFDISDPFNIFQRYYTSLTDGTTLSKMYVHEEVLMLFGGEFDYDYPSPLILLNITDIDNPIEIGRYYEEKTTILDGVVKEETLYVLTENDGVRLFNYTEPDNLQLMANYSLAGNYRNAFFSSERMYLVSRSFGIEILTYDQTIDEVASLGHLWQGGETFGMAVNGTKAYLVNGWNGLTIMNITYLTEPKKISSIKSFTKYYDSVAVSGKYVYLFNLNTISLDIYDVSMPTSPIAIFENSTQEYSYNYEESRIIVNEQLAYVLIKNYFNQGYGSKLLIFNITNPENPQKISETIFGKYVLDISMDQRTLFLVGTGGLLIFNVTASGTLISIANFTAGTDSFGGVAVAGNYVFIADNSYGLRIVDISKLTDPVEVGKYATTAGWGIAVNDKTVYLKDYKNGLLLLDVSSVIRPKLVGQYYYVVSEKDYQYGNYGSNIMGVYVEEKTVFLAMDWEGMIILENTYSGLSTAARNTLIITVTIGGTIIVMIVLIGIYQEKKKVKTKNLGTNGIES